MNGLTFFAVLSLLFIAGCAVYSLFAKGEEQPDHRYDLGYRLAALTAAADRVVENPTELHLSLLADAVAAVHAAEQPLDDPDVIAHQMHEESR